MRRRKRTDNLMQAIRSHTLMAMLATLFAATQILCCFHTHDPLEHENDGIAQETACDICLISSMPADVDADAATIIPTYSSITTRILANNSFRPTYSASPDSARAPPYT